METQSVWHGTYLDGKTAASREAVITILKTGVKIDPAGGEAVLWAFDAVQQTQGFHAGEPVRLENGLAALVVDDQGFLKALKSTAPGPGKRFSGYDARKKRDKLLAVAIAGTLALVAILYLWGLEAGAKIIASRIPPEWEADIGSSVAASFTKRGSLCSAEPVEKAIAAIIDRLGRATKGQPYGFKIHVIKDDTVNALAAPGGHIILFTGLLEMTDTPEELAGVLAHEMQHVIRKHALRSLIQNLSLDLLISMLLGDLGRAAEFAGKAATIMGSMKYTRALEEEADKGGIEMLMAADADPAGMINFFAKLNEKHPDASGPLKYVASHPQTAERIRYLKASRKARGNRYTPLLEGVEWSVVKNSCAKTARDNPHPSTP